MVAVEAKAPVAVVLAAAAMVEASVVAMVARVVVNTPHVPKAHAARKVRDVDAAPWVVAWVAMPNPAATKVGLPVVAVASTSRAHPAQPLAASPTPCAPVSI